MSIDINALKAEVQLAQQSGRKMCMVPTGELDSLLRRAETMVSVQNLIPFKIGFACQDDVHRMLQGELFRVGLQRTKGPRYNVEVLVQSLPCGKKNGEPTFDLKRLLAEAT